MGAVVKHAALSGAGSGAGGTIGATNWDAAHTITGLYNRYPCVILAGGGTTIAIAGSAGGNSVSNTGTNSAFGQGALVSYTRFISAATANATASSSYHISAYIPPLSSRQSPGISLTATLYFADASYGSGSTGARIVFGATRDAPSILTGDNGDQTSNQTQGIWFSYSTNRGGNWQIVIYSTLATYTLVDTGVAWTPGTWSFVLDFLEGAATFNWSIRNIGGSSASGTVTNAVNPFPVNVTDAYFMVAGLMTLTTTARTIGIVRMGVDLLEPV